MHLESIPALDLSEATPEHPVGKATRRQLSLSRADIVADNWSSEVEAGYRLYRLFPRQNMYGLARYERDVDPETEELTEEESLVKYGFASIADVYVPPVKTAIGESSLLSRNVGQIRTTYRNFSRDAIEEALNEGEDLLEVLGQYVLYSEPDDVLGAMIDHDPKYDGANPSNADERLKVAEKFADEMRPAGEEGVYYVGKLEFSNAPEWYLRAAELHLNGVLKNRPTVSLVQAINESDSPRFETQEDIASSLGLTQGTVSKHLATAEEWMDRAEWHADNC